MTEEVDPGMEEYGRRARRVAVSDKSYNPENMKGRAPKIPKSDKDRKRIKEKLKTNFLFQHLTDEGLGELIDVVAEKKFKDGDIVIQQGDKGDFFYILDDGTCEIFVNDNLVMTCKPGDTFGELALMYNAPRAATVKATSNVRTWAMDRDTFKFTLMSHTMKKRDLYEAFLREVPLLSSMLDYERLTIADALKPEKYSKGHPIITQGEEGDKFYIVEAGELKIVKDGEDMGVIESGGYFGELALLTDKPRAASIIVKSSEATVLAIDKKTFIGVMGPTHLLLKRRAVDTYAKYMNDDFTSAMADNEEDDGDE